MTRWILAALAVLAVATAAPAADAAIFKCPPCGQECDAIEFPAAGTCPNCGMTLVEAGTQARVAILIFDGVQIIDYTGPYEVFGQARFEVCTVAAAADTIVTAMDMRVVPAYTIANAPSPDVLVVPGGHVEDVIATPAVMDWLRASSASADQVLSVCNGAFILAAAGLLDGLEATTFYGLLNQLERTATKTRVVRDERFVDNGRIITSAGLSSGIDASLHVIEKRLGRGRAQAIAVHLEYDWNPDPDAGFARGALALVQFEHAPVLLDGLTNTLVSTAGDRDRWRVERDVATDLTAEALHRRFVGLIEEDGRLERAEGGAARANTSRWTRTAADGAHWRWTIGVEPAGEGTVRATFEVERTGETVSRR